MQKKKTAIISSIVIISLIITLWFSGIIPKQIAKHYGVSYVNEHFPEMQLEYVNVEWNKYYGDYVITFKDKNGKNYGCVIGPKYLPIGMGQGIAVVEEEYRENYK